MPDASTRGRSAFEMAATVGMVLGILGLLAWLATGSVNRMTRAGEPLDRQFRDFYEFYSGAEALVRGTDLYKAGELGYIYPPLLAVLMTPLVSLGIQVAGVVWLCNRLALLVLILVLGADEMIRRFNLRRDAMTFAAFVLGVMLLLADKLRAEMNMGQSNLLMVL
ncbi:MAG: glycosyltransferase 87 family protein, partial [bacterium]